MLARVAALFFVTLSAFGPAADASTEIGWPDLVDQSAQSFEDPYRDLSYDQIDAVRNVLVARQELSSAILSDGARKALESNLSDLQSTLSDQSLDADWLIDQRWIVAERRERAAKAGNPAVDGQTVTLLGFAIAGPPDPDGTSVVYLVPERGMCSHIPPPPPNQMLRVRLSDGWRPQYIHEPVRITGQLAIEPSEQVFHVVDGPVAMSATFRLDAEIVETVQQMRGFGDPNSATNEWLSGIAERLRASGKLPHSPTTAAE